MSEVQDGTCVDCAYATPGSYRDCEEYFVGCNLTGDLCPTCCSCPKWAPRGDVIDRLNYWALSNMEGCDEPEFSLFAGIVDAVYMYRKGLSLSDRTIMGVPIDEACTMLRRYRRLEDVARELYSLARSLLEAIWSVAKSDDADTRGLAAAGTVGEHVSALAMAKGQLEALGVIVDAD